MGVKHCGGLVVGSERALEHADMYYEQIRKRRKEYYLKKKLWK